MPRGIDNREEMGKAKNTEKAKSLKKSKRPKKKLPKRLKMRREGKGHTVQNAKKAKKPN